MVYSLVYIYIYLFTVSHNWGKTVLCVLKIGEVGVSGTLISNQNDLESSELIKKKKPLRGPARQGVFVCVVDS